MRVNRTAVELTIILGTGLLLVGAGYPFWNSNRLAQLRAEEAIQKTHIMLGTIASIDETAQSFVLQRLSRKDRYVVKVQASTVMSKVVVPAPLIGQSVEVALTPKEEPVRFGDLQLQQQVLVRASGFISYGQDIQDPTEIHILP